MDRQTRRVVFNQTLIFVYLDKELHFPAGLERKQFKRAEQFNVFLYGNGIIFGSVNKAGGEIIITIINTNPEAGRGGIIQIADNYSCRMRFDKTDGDGVIGVKRLFCRFGGNETKTEILPVKTEENIAD